MPQDHKLVPREPCRTYTNIMNILVHNAPASHKTSSIIESQGDVEGGYAVTSRKIYCVKVE